MSASGVPFSDRVPTIPLIDRQLPHLLIQQPPLKSQDTCSVRPVAAGLLQRCAYQLPLHSREHFPVTGAERYSAFPCCASLVAAAADNLLRLRQEVPLTEPELAAVEQGLTGYEKLLETLADVPAPGRLYEIQTLPSVRAV